MLVAKDGKILYEKAIGWADYLHRDSLKINSEFELASITKTFTGVAIMQLVEAGKLSLNDDVKKILSQFPLRWHYGKTFIKPPQRNDELRLLY